MDDAEGSAPPSGYRPISDFVRPCLVGEHVLDIGYKGSRVNPLPIVPHAVGVDLDFPGYDGIHLPFEDGSQDAVHASHCLEHIAEYQVAIADWYRVLKISGYLIIMVPHQQLYERKAAPPSRWTGDHKRFYTPRSLLEEVESALPVCGWRLRSLRDVDDGFDYFASVEQHARGLCEIEAIIQKVSVPGWASALTEKPAAKLVVELVASLVSLGVKALRDGNPRAIAEARQAIAEVSLPPYRRLAISLAGTNAENSEVMEVLGPVVAAARFDETWYLATYPDIRAAVASGTIKSGHVHYVSGGYFEGRLAGPPRPIFD
jgi:Methyltransferase domain